MASASAAKAQVPAERLNAQRPDHLPPLNVCLEVNIDREPRNIWGPDYGASVEPRPLLAVEHVESRAKLAKSELVEANLRLVVSIAR